MAPGRNTGPYSRPASPTEVWEIIDIPDDDDVELLDERPSLNNAQAMDALVKDAGGYPKPGVPSPAWREVSQDRSSGIHVGQILKLGTNGDLVRVENVLRHNRRDDLIAVHGLRLRKMSRMPGGFHHSSNELVVIQDIYTDSIATSEGFFLEAFIPTDFRSATNVQIRMTNMLRQSGAQRGRLTALVPALPARDHHSIRTCRSVYSTCYDRQSNANAARKTQEIWQNIQESQADPDFRIEDRLYRQARKSIHEAQRVHNQVQDPPPGYVNIEKLYTALDGFCGGGFASEGAKMASLHVVWSFDRDADALRTYQKNHASVKALLMDFFEVVKRHGDNIKIDVLMLSFPCQYFSPVHTRPGPNDEANEVAMLGLGDILAKLMPRLVVIEQTFGMDQIRFREHLMAVIAGFRDLDYSVRKGVINFAGLGFSGTRRRLMFIGAAPGEALPPFPRQTHNTDVSRQDANLLPAVTVAQALSRVSAGHPDHNFDRIDLAVPLPYYDPRERQLGTLTCSHSRTDRNTVHWSGRRYWTVHELLLLQSAPPSYRMAPGLTLQTQLRQIGNAFPCIPAAAIYKECHKSLQKTDEDDQLYEAMQASQELA